MAVTARVSPFISLAFANPIRFSLSPSANLASPHQSLDQHRNSTSFESPRISIRRGIGKLNASIRGEPKEIDEAFFDGDDVIEDESDGEETESSVDLLFRFFQSLFKKVSKRAKKASRSVLPAAISPQLVSFAVDGVLLLASLSIVKALLESKQTCGCGSIFWLHIFHKSQYITFNILD
ncbi:protein SHORT HYPOCOTYL IN WHITE LIGHT 1 isoform X2 [Malania oleifera]|uniref:protein SHORT HYPOCOTYL IN WHITE LIGHT 1 isoform X2 n=1 Tax=Malania oleifera TaxID=397392 RepID=UPI0025AE86D4|nr:protein SHORT HYPOCOTYL IN WHITE LIGHT 1 isoform X2 [Malania oleifera]